MLQVNLTGKQKEKRKGKLWRIITNLKGRESLKELCWMSRRLGWDILFPLASVFLLVAVGYYLLKLFAPEADIVAREFQGFVTILWIVLGVVIGIGLALFWSIRKLTEESVLKDMRREFSKIRGKLDISIGYSFYSAGDYDLAIERTELALEETLEELDELYAKNNLAYYYIAKGVEKLSDAERTRAERWAEFVYGRYDKWKKDFDDPTWAETYAFVKARIATKENRQRIKKEIEEMLIKDEFASVKGDLENSLQYLYNVDVKGTH